MYIMMFKPATKSIISHQHLSDMSSFHCLRMVSVMMVAVVPPVLLICEYTSADPEYCPVWPFD